MDSQKLWKYSSEEQEKLAELLISLEKAALDKWFKGDISGYLDLWSKNSFTYFDGTISKRIEDHNGIEKHLEHLKGKLFAEKYDFVEPRIQFCNGNDMGILTYQLFSNTNLDNDMKYNCIEVFQKEKDGNWKVVHSTWSWIKPMEKDFEKLKKNINK